MAFKASQREIELAAGSVAHIPVVIRYIDAGEAQVGTVLLMHGIPTWGYLYHVPPGTRPRHVVIDATGLKVYGAGEWHVRKHRRGRRRTWRKLHLSVDETTKEIVAAEITESNVHDSRQLPALWDQVPGEIRQVSGDCAYDTRACYESVLERDAIVTIPPRRNARKRPSAAGKDWREVRNATLQQIQELGRYEWRVRSGCTRQSLAENAVSRFKSLLGTTVAARKFDNQRAEAIVKCGVLNRMTSLGMPDSGRI